jgi:type I restriction-modification system DNA methylase subunit
MVNMNNLNMTCTGVKLNLVDYKQFFTPIEYSKLLIEQVAIEKPEKILDLTMGSGNLLSEAMKHWPNCNFFGNDIDKRCVYNEDLKNAKNFRMFNKNILKRNSAKDIKKKCWRG